MKTQQHPIIITQKEEGFDKDTFVRGVKDHIDAISDGKEYSFDVDWSYSYMMDYICLHKKIKKLNHDC